MSFVLRAIEMKSIETDEKSIKEYKQVLRKIGGRILPMRLR